ncbi:hypothetical protein [Halopiger djelfimassiliensis]|uniref:hypothetical protein n=1 Tax=Halopiger djelfimassiliensis TaxID=1293047 RepID=UPI000B1ED611|nr:hypothetical protein [Halopiger djelfimassiliensis]
MPVHIECDACGDAHTIPDRASDPEAAGTVCPNCGARPFTVARNGLEWHPEP